MTVTTSERKTIGEIERELAAQITQTVVPLQTTRDVDAAGLDSLVRLAEAGAAVLRGESHLPRSFLRELYVLVQVLRAEADHATDPRVGETANQLEMVFGLILRGEAPGERTPGVPRI